MFKKTVLSLLLALAGASAFAADYYLVVPVKGRTSTDPYAAIKVALNAYTLPGAEVGTAYSFDLKPLLAVSGDANFDASQVTWSLDGTTLPAGLSLNADGTLSGTPASAGTTNFSVRATYKTKSGVQSYQVVAVNIVVTLSGGTLPSVGLNTPYTYSLYNKLAVTGDANYVSGSGVTWSQTGGSLPTGLTLNSNGSLTGTVAEFADTGTTFSARATYKNKTSDATYTLLPGDPSYASVAALLKMDGTAGSTSIVDAKGGTYTPYSVSISSTTAKFNESGYFAGGSAKGVVGPVISLPGDFTLETWVNPSAASLTPAMVPLMAQWHQAVGWGGYLLAISSGSVNFYFYPFSGSNIFMSAGTIPANTWSHVAVTRSGSTWRMFINGTQKATTTFSSAGPNLSVNFTLGNYYNSSGVFGATGATSFSGYMDEVRVTKGVSRYNAAFTPSAYPFTTR